MLSCSPWCCCLQKRLPRTATHSVQCFAVSKLSEETKRQQLSQHCSCATEGEKQDCTRQQRAVTGHRKLSLSRSRAKWHFPAVSLGQSRAIPYPGVLLLSAVQPGVLDLLLLLGHLHDLLKGSIILTRVLGQECVQAGKSIFLILFCFSYQEKGRSLRKVNASLSRGALDLPLDPPGSKPSTHTNNYHRARPRYRSTHSGAEINQVWNTAFNKPFYGIYSNLF